MKDYEFRGLDKCGIWHYGDVIFTLPFDDGHRSAWIKPRDLLGLGVVSTPTGAFMEVVTETIGQYIGEKDSDGVKIFEGDIVKDEYGQINAIEFSNGSFWFNWLEMPHYMDQINKGTVIGNVHTDPQLRRRQND